MSLGSIAAQEQPPQEAATSTVIDSASVVDAAPTTSIDSGNVADEEYVELGRQIQDAWNAKDRSQFSALFDWDRFGEIVLADSLLSARDRVISLRALQDALSAGLGLAATVETIADNGARFIRVRSVGNQKRLLVRKITSHGGCHFHEFIPERRPNGKLRIVDQYVYVTGELMSQTVRRFYSRSAMASANPGFLARMMGADPVAARKDLNDLIEFNDNLGAGRDADAIRIYRQLPESSRNEKGLMLSYIQAMQRTGDPDCSSALEAFQKRFPNDAALELVMAHYHMRQKDHLQAIESLRRVESALGGDHYLHALLAVQLSKLGRIEESKHAAEDAIQGEPQLELPHTLLLNLSLQENDHAETLHRLKALYTQCQTEFEDLTTVPEYAEFVRSPHHQEWLQFLETN